MGWLQLTDALPFRDILELESSGDNTLSPLVVLGRYPVTNGVEAHPSRCRDI